jgi:hypothetical protein
MKGSQPKSISFPSLTIPGSWDAAGRSILKHREEKGGFKDRQELLKIKGFGPKSAWPNGGGKTCWDYLGLGATTVDATTVIDGNTLFWRVSCHFFGAPNMRKWINIRFGYLRVLHKSELKSDYPKLDSFGSLPRFLAGCRFSAHFWGFRTAGCPSHPSWEWFGRMAGGRSNCQRHYQGQSREVREDDDWMICLFIYKFIYLFNIILYILYYLINYIYIKMNLSLSMLSSLSMSILSLSILEAARVRESSVDSCVTFLLGRLAAFKVNREA